MQNLNVTSYNLEIGRLQGRLGIMDIPVGFEPNMGNMSNTVPLSMGEQVIPQFI